MGIKKSLAKEALKDKQKPLQQMYTKVPRHYDLINRLFTLRMDELWRKKAVRECLKHNPLHIMDLGTGTGDLALRIAKQAPSIHITGYDFSQPMLDIALKKAREERAKNVEFIEGDAAQMPFRDNSFDAITIAFAFRNMTFNNPNRSSYLTEMHRTLKPGGKLVIVESSQPKNLIIRKLHHLYLEHIVSGMGGWISGEKGAYHYLAYSSKHFYSRPELKKLLEHHGFHNVKSKPLFFGAAALTVAYK
ncbi:MAG: bifunctional demethylmenaquinone methyltransferase/2-methoxy-6-polyprenyl-1,4-benzoquinol methylase UbiE [Bacteroidales bacterium]|nr:bifunctional demethylmenaquinone methyltransferase/2-methoxy-6-polyprenyl-1,4-benzoquinol methylase UbiE [Bacteroidales bacterium]